jgi:hypothetical protein
MIVADSINVTSEGSYVVLEIKGDDQTFQFGVLPVTAFTLQAALAMRAHEVTQR